MKFIWDHSAKIIDVYSGAIPLNSFLKTYFAKHRQLGSRDRKAIANMVYCWYRCNKGVSGADGFRQKMQCCLFLCETNTHLLPGFLPDEWYPLQKTKFCDKLKFLKQSGFDFDIEKIAPFSLALSEGVDRSQWLLSMLQQPNVFIRLRKEKDQILRTLLEQKIAFKEIDQECLSLPGMVALSSLLKEDTYVVQDWSSQQTGRFFQPLPSQSWWDCCCGAGGKSLLLLDMQTQLHLTVSDKRPSMLLELNERFQRYHLSAPDALVLDLTQHRQLDKQLGNKRFDAIICDAPCTGSGTWARTPEQLYFFKPDNISPYQERQKILAENASFFLKEGGRFYYITCSVFRDENEEVVNHLIENQRLSLISQNVISGLARKADTMFISVLKR